MKNINSSVDRNIINRKSLLAFSSKPVEKVKLEIIFEAARWAPSSFNAQPWRYIYAGKDDKGYQLLLSLLFDSNKEWAKTAPMLILSITEMIDIKKNRINRFAFHDLGLSTANLILQATSLGLFAHPMGGFNESLAIEIFQIPNGFKAGAIIALGYPGNPSILSEDLLKRQTAPRVRKNLEEIAFKGGWKGKRSEPGS